PWRTATDPLPPCGGGLGWGVEALPPPPHPPPQGGGGQKAGLRSLWWVAGAAFALFPAGPPRAAGARHWGRGPHPASGAAGAGGGPAARAGGVVAAGGLVGGLRTSGAAGLSVAGACLLGVGLIAAMHYPALARPAFLAVAGPPTEKHPLPLRRIDPTCRLRGW